jgi:hypothetical protein
MSQNQRTGEKMTSENIMREIRSGRFTNSELNDMGQAIQFARAQLVQEIKREIRPGLTVYFKDRYGSRVVGTVESVKIKNAIVQTSRAKYRVPCNMLEMS